MPFDFAKMEAKARRDFKRRHAALKGKETKILVSTGLALDMLFDPRIGQGVADLMAVSYGSATGQSAQRRECFGCLKLWSLQRAIVGMALIEFLDGSNTALLCGLCHECTGDNDILRAAIMRDFGGNPQIVHQSYGTA